MCNLRKFPFGFVARFAVLSHIQHLFKISDLLFPKHCRLWIGGARVKFVGCVTFRVFFQSVVKIIRLPHWYLLGLGFLCNLILRRKEMDGSR